MKIDPKIALTKEDKMKKFTKAVKILALLFLVFSILPVQEVFAKEDIHILVKGQLVEESQAFIEEDRTLVPLRFVAENLGYEVAYDEDARQVTIANEEINMQMKIGETEYKLNQESIEMDVAPIIRDSRTYVPVRFVAESFGEEVAWDPSNRAVIIGHYGGSSIDDAETVEYYIGELKFTLDLSDDFKDTIGVDLRDDSIRFYDKYNKDQSKDASSGALCIINISEDSDFLVAPSIVLEYDDGHYIQAMFESGVEYSTQDDIFKEKYDQSLKLVKETLKTYKRIKKKTRNTPPLKS